MATTFNGNGSDQLSVNDGFRMLGTKAPISRHWWSISK